MNLQAIHNIALIKKSNLDPNQYTISLLKEAFRSGLLDKNKIDNIQMQIVLILKDLILRYTKGESTSVTTETAEKLLNSIYYSIDACLSTLENPEESIVLLKTKKIKEIYEEGIKIVKACTAEAKILYDEINACKLDVPLEAYNATLEAIPDFFSNYCVMFFAHDTMADIDYPLLFDNTSIRGIFYIKQYLEKLKIETEFCKLFNDIDIRKILKNYGRICSIDYEKALINIFELLVINSIFSILSGNNGNRLAISNFQYEYLKNMLIGLNTSGIDSLVSQAVNRMINDLGICNPKLINYVEKYKPTFVTRLINALENNSLPNLVITDNEDTLQNNTITFEEGDRMDDDSFRFIVHRLNQCKNTEEKLKLISSSIYSLQDFIDILKSDCLFGEEFVAVFSTLSDMELSVLGKTVFWEELRDNPLNLSSININKKEETAEPDWHLQYIKFIKGLSTDRLKSIISIINAIQ